MSGTDLAVDARRLTLPTLATIAVVTAALHFGRDVFLPLAFAMLITFALSPAVSALRRRGVPKLLTVLAVVTMAFAVIATFLVIVTSQLGQVAANLPTFQANIVSKLDAIEASGSASGVVSRLSGLFEAVSDRMAVAAPGDQGAATGAPVTVRVVEPSNPLSVLRDVVLPLLSPVATAGLVIVVVIFMLLEREELRDRFIRLAGSQDLYRSTEMLEDAGSRVANYLVTQLLVNVIYAVPIGLGLWLIGVPNAVLWGLMTLVLRFVPYIGSALAAAFPLLLAFAVAPGWSVVLWTAGLFLTVELVTSNIVEPWLYGSRTGLTPLAIIVAAIVWTWIWGPLGLVLSTPLTVCLVVLGRHLPQFELFDILFGDEPVLSAHSRLYQRLLAGDVIGCTARAEEDLEEAYIADYYRDVGIPALFLGQRDMQRGVLSAAQEGRLSDAAQALLGELEPVVGVELADLTRGLGAEGAAPPDDGEERGDAGHVALEGEGYSIVCIGGRSVLDDVAAGMLAQSMAADGAQVAVLSHSDLTTARFAAVAGTDATCVVLNFLDAAPSRASLLQVRRIKRAAPHLRVGVVLWQMPEAILSEIGERGDDFRASPDKRREADEIGADFVVTGSEDARAAAYSDDAPTVVPQLPRRQARSPLRARQAMQG